MKTSNPTLARFYVVLAIFLGATAATMRHCASAQELDRQTAKIREKAKRKPAEFAWVNRLSKNANPALQHHTFQSKRVGKPVGFVVLLPAELRGDGRTGLGTDERRYPVVYHLHGGRPGSETKATGIAGEILAAVQQAKELGQPLPPMIHVFVNGGPVSHYNVPGQAGAMGADVFIKELIPHVDALFPTVAKRSGRALTGFSQGGRGTMRLALRNPDLFCCAAAGGGGYATEKLISENDGVERPGLKFAAGDNAWDLARHYAADSNRPALDLLIYVGSEGFNYSNNVQYMEFLKSLGIAHQSLIVPGVDHSNRKIYQRKVGAILGFLANSLKHDDR